MGFARCSRACWRTSRDRCRRLAGVSLSEARARPPLGTPEVRGGQRQAASGPAVLEPGGDLDQATAGEVHHRGRYAKTCPDASRGFDLAPPNGADGVAERQDAKSWPP